MTSRNVWFWLFVFYFCYDNSVIGRDSTKREVFLTLQSAINPFFVYEYAIYRSFNIICVGESFSLPFLEFSNF